MAEAPTTRRRFPRWSTREVCAPGRSRRFPVIPTAGDETPEMWRAPGSGDLGCRAVTPDDLLAAYDDQLRTDAEMARAHEVVREGPLLWARLRPRRVRRPTATSAASTGRGARRRSSSGRSPTTATTPTSPRSSGSRAGTTCPADLGERLVAHGLVAEPVETVMIGEASLLAVDVPLAETRRGPRRRTPDPRAGPTWSTT